MVIAIIGSQDEIQRTTNLDNRIIQLEINTAHQENQKEEFKKREAQFNSRLKQSKELELEVQTILANYEKEKPAILSQITQSEILSTTAKNINKDSAILMEHVGALKAQSIELAHVKENYNKKLMTANPLTDTGIHFTRQACVAVAGVTLVGASLVAAAACKLLMC